MKKPRLYHPQARDWTGLGVGFLVGASVAIILAYAVVHQWL